jgi:tellurite resistance protein TehA-like permease
MIDSVVAVSVTISLTILLISASDRQALDRITAAQLLPIAASIVAAGTGARVAEHLPNPQHALGTIIASYVMWGMSTPLAMTVLVMYYTRLALHKLPPREIVVSSFLPLGPLGMGGYSITYLGMVSRRVFPETEFFSDIPVAGDIFFVVGIFIALIMWAFGLTWLCFALASIYKSRPFPFNMGWWGFTFPLGVMALSTMELGNIFPSLFFRVLGTIFAVAVILLWCVVAVGTARGAWSGRLFNAPCLKNLPKKDSLGHDETEKEKGPVQT